MRPYPADPQWQRLDRKLPPDQVVATLLRVGFRVTDIADRFDVTVGRVSLAARRAGVPPVEPGSTCGRRNGAYQSRWARMAEVRAP